MSTVNTIGWSVNELGVTVNGSSVPAATPGCPLRLNVRETDTPDDWVVVGDGHSKVTAVQTFDRDESYILSTGPNTSQWYKVEDYPAGQDTMSVIHAVKVTACFRSDDPTNSGGLRIDMRVGDSSVGANDHYSRCDYSCVTATFFYNPNVDPPAAFTWADINELEVGVTSRGTGETRVSKLMVDVICGDLWTPCPRCCCCCMCFTPTIRWTGVVFGDGFTPEVGSVTISVPYRGQYGDGCWYFTDETTHDFPILLGSQSYSCGDSCTGTCNLYLNAAGMIASVTSLPNCNDVLLQLLRVCTDTLSGSFTTTYNVRADPVLLCCDPHHLSITDTVTIDGITCGVGVLDCGQIEVECLDMIGDVSIGTDCKALA